MRVFVTGGTGFIGDVLCRRLVADGHEVRCLVRSTSRTESLEAMGASCFVGDLADRYSMREPMSGAEWVIHAGAELDLTRAADQMQAANVAGSENVASLAWKLGVGRVLSVSSVAYFGGSPDDGSPGTEESPVLSFPTRYSSTKHAGQQAVMHWAKEGLAVNTVFPSLVYGPPGKKSGANPLIRRLAKGWMPALVGAERKTSWIFVEDLVDGMVRVIERAEPGRDFLMTGDTATIEEVAQQVCKLSGASMPKRKLSVRAARMLTRLSTPLYRLRGRKPPIDVEQLRSLDRHWCFDDKRARQELEWSPRPLSEGLPPSVEYFLSV
jgi:nucleoside-diphosphate-sugar epimerase